MVYYTVHYRFSQSFPFPAREVYDWATDFQEEDVVLSGRTGTREVERLDDATLILTDTVVNGGKSVTKVRLIRLFPDILTYTNTRISTQGRHSQFIYQIIPEGAKASRLEFSGAQVERAKTKPSGSALKAAAKELRETDVLIWVHLAAAMGKDLGPKRSRGTSGSRAR